MAYWIIGGVAVLVAVVIFHYRSNSKAYNEGYEDGARVGGYMDAKRGRTPIRK